MFFLDGKIAIGGFYDSSDLYIEPTVLYDIQLSDPIMKEEIFGPLLPIVNINDVAEAIRIINAGEKPLAIYCFSKNKKVQNLFLNHTSSGGVLVNDTVMHCMCTTLPFGGVGNSGLGAYRGKYTFDTFSHMKGSMVKSINSIGELVNMPRYMPYSNQKIDFIARVLKPWPPIPGTKYLPALFMFVLGAIVAFVIFVLLKKVNKI